MGFIKKVEHPNGPFCMCIPPLWFTVGVGTVWQCDSCGRVYELVADRGEGKGSGWKKVKG